MEKCFVLGFTLCSLYPAHPSTTWVNNVAQFSWDTAGLKVLYPGKSFSPGKPGTTGDPTISDLWFGDSLRQRDGFACQLGLAGVVSGCHCSVPLAGQVTSPHHLTSMGSFPRSLPSLPLSGSSPSKNTVNTCRNNRCELEAIYSCKIRNAFLKNREINFKTA